MKSSPINRKPPEANPAATWEEEIASVKPLGSKSAPQAPKPKLPPAPPPIKHYAVAGWNDSQPIPIHENTAQCIRGHADHLEKNIPKDLAAGKIHYTASIDLHGLGEGDAWLHLVDFLHAAADNDHRCALVIHGKGYGYGPNRDMGVIKFQIGSWLAGHPKVLAFHTALPQDGGQGAIYVYLKRRRI